MIPLTQAQLDAMLDNEKPGQHYIDPGSLSLLRIQGEDAESFLQGQLSNDITKLGHGQSQLHAYCNPKGRTLAILRIMRSENGFWALIPNDLVASFLKRIKMFVIRARVTIEIESDFHCLGFVGEVDSPAQDFIASGGNLYCVDEPRSRYLLIGNDDLIKRISNQDNTAVFHGDYWRALDILSAIPQVYANTIETFIPQNINLELVDGVSFKKGCFPGQEIIARLKYLGKSKKRLIVARVNSVNPVVPGNAIYTGDNPDSKAGAVVDSVGLDDRINLISAMVPATSIDHGVLTVGSATGDQLERIAMPYVIPVE